MSSKIQKFKGAVTIIKQKDTVVPGPYATLRDLLIWALEEDVDMDTKILVAAKTRDRQTHFSAANIGDHITYAEDENSLIFRVDLSR